MVQLPTCEGDIRISQNLMKTLKNHISWMDYPFLSKFWMYIAFKKYSTFNEFIFFSEYSVLLTISIIWLHCLIMQAVVTGDGGAEPRGRPWGHQGEVHPGGGAAKRPQGAQGQDGGMDPEAVWERRHHGRLDLQTHGVSLAIRWEPKLILFICLFIYKLISSSILAFINSFICLVYLIIHLYLYIKLFAY